MVYALDPLAYRIPKVRACLTIWNPKLNVRCGRPAHRLHTPSAPRMEGVVAQGVHQVTGSGQSATRRSGMPRPWSPTLCAVDCPGEVSQAALRVLDRPVKYCYPCTCVGLPWAAAILGIPSELPQPASFYRVGWGLRGPAWTLCKGCARGLLEGEGALGANSGRLQSGWGAL